jgi:D-galactarolactone cycloisomerase
MKIVKVEGIPLSAKIDNPFRISTTRFSEVRALVVKLTTDNGLVGVGESLVRESPKATKYLVEEMLAPQIIGEDPLDAAAIWWKMFSVMRTRGHTKGTFLEAISGVDVAIWDIIGKSLNMPTYKVLNGFGRKEITAYGSSVFIGDIENMINQTKKFLEKGYMTIKIKLGMGVQKDVKAIKAIREYVGESVRLMIDCNSIYDAGTAIELGRKLEKYDIYWMEEPVPPYDLEGYRLVRNNQPLRLASGEGEYGIYGFRDLLDTNSLSIVQPDLGRVGGYTEGMRVAALIYSKNLKIAPHTGMCSALNIVASMHYAAAAPNLFMFEFMDLEHPLIEIFSTPVLRPEKGIIKMPDKPGLGLELDMNKISKWIQS